MGNRHRDDIPQKICYEFNIQPLPNTFYDRWDHPIAGEHNFRFCHIQDKSKIFIKYVDP